MKFDPMNCPDCGKPAIGTIDIIPGCCLFTSPDADGCVDYAGETKLFWEGQTPETNENDHVLLRCHCGHEWWAQELDVPQTEDEADAPSE